MWTCILLKKDGVWQVSKIRHNHWTSKMSKMYRSALKLPLIRTRYVHFLYPMAAQTIVPGVRPLCRYGMQAGHLRCPRNLQTCIQPSEYCKQSRNSSEDTTFDHFFYRALSIGAPELTSLFILHFQGKSN